MSRPDERESGLTPARVEWVVTTQHAAWQPQNPPPLDTAGGGVDVIVRTDAPRQPMDGFGCCFNELGWTALGLLRPEAREAILRELFAPGVGANFMLCRMPI